MPERILVIHDGKMNGYGLDLVTEQQVLALTEAGYQVDLLARGGLDLPNVRSLVHRYTWANLISWVGREKYYDAKKRAFTSLGCARLHRETYAAIVSWVNGLLPMVRLAQRQRVPLLLNVPRNFAVGQPVGAYPDVENLPIWQWPLISQAEKRSEYLETQVDLLLPSRYCYDLLQQSGVAAERLHLIERGYEPKQFYPAEEKPTRFRLLFCGKIAPRKGVMQALRAWREAGLSQGEFWFAGKTPPAHERQWREAAGDNVQFLGFRRDLGDVMRQCQAQILLSHDEGQAKSLIEGAASGLVTIATEVTGFPFERGKMGFAVEAEDSSGIALVLKRLHDEPGLVRELSANSVRLMREHYSWEAFRARFVTAIENSRSHFSARD